MVKSIAMLACRAIAAGAICSNAFAQPVAGSGSLTHAVEAAWQQSVHRSAATGDIALAQANRGAAQAVWAAPPSLEFSRRGEPLASSVSGQRESEVGIAWPLLLPGQRSARGASAEADFSTAEAAQRAAKLRVAGEVRESAWRVVGAQAALSIAEGHAQNLERLADDVRRRVEAGDLARADALAARAEALAAGTALADARQHLAAARARWKVLTGTETVPDALEPAVDAAAQEHPELLLARVKSDAARKRLDLVRIARSDPPEIMLRYRNDVPAAGLASQNSIGLALRVPLGTDDRNVPREAAALAALDVAQTEERRARERLDAETTTARAAAAVAERQAAMEESRAALLRERAQLLEKSLRAGETALPELLRTLAAAVQSEGGLARQRAELGLARARARQTAGLLP